MKKFWIVLIFSLVLSLPAKALDLSVVGGLGFTKPSGDISGTPIVFSSNTAFGVGGLLGFTANWLLTFETGLLYMPRKFAQPSFSDVTLTTLQFPLILRFQFVPFFSVGVGGYFAQGIGNVSTTATGSSTSTDVDYATFNLSKSDIGLIGSAALYLPVLPTMSLLADFRYLLGLKNISLASTTTIRLREFQILFGLRLSY